MGSQVWFVTGSSRGLGFAIAQAVLEKGDAVVAAARNASRAEQVLGPSDRVFAVSIDVTDRASIQRAADTAVARFGKIDVIVNNAGYGLMGAVEELDALELEDVFKTNFFGAREVIRALLPTLRAQRAGWIVNISSVGGFTGSPGAGHTMPANSPSRAYQKRWRRSWLRLVSVSSLSSRAIFAPIS